MLTRTGLAFAGLNFLRLLSIIATLLVLAATLEVMVLDGRLVSSARKEDATVWEDCEYVPGTDVPTHAWGLFWTQLDRTFVLILCIICVLSEMNWGGYCEKSFNYCLPVLGRNSGTGALGCVQMMIGANLLSHYLEGFALVTAWLLFLIGLLNFLFGISFKQPAKDYRSFSASRRAAARGLSPPRNPGDIEKGTMAGLAASGSSGEGARQVRTLGEAFAHPGVASHQELLRQQARQANEKIEREIEARLASDLRAMGGHVGSDSGLPGAFIYDSDKGTNIVLGRPPTRATDYSLGHRVVPLSRENSRSVASPPYTREPNTFLANVGLAHKGSGVTPTSQKGGFKRRSLALAKATRRRLSYTSSTSRGGINGRRRSIFWGQAGHTVPSLTRRRLAQQAEKERDQLLRLAAELKLPRTAGEGEVEEEHDPFRAPPTIVGTEAAPSIKSVYSRIDETHNSIAVPPAAPTTAYSPTSTTGFTSVLSRSHSRFGAREHRTLPHDGEAEEEAEEVTFHTSEREVPPLPAYEPRRFGTTTTTTTTTAVLAPNYSRPAAAATTTAAGFVVPATGTSQIASTQTQTQLSRLGSNASSIGLTRPLQTRITSGGQEDLSKTPIARQWTSEWGRDYQRQRQQQQQEQGQQVRRGPTRNPPPPRF